MPVLKDELVKDLETPEYQTLVRETLAKKDFVVYTKDEHAQYLDRFKTDVVEKELPSRLSKVYSDLDKDIKETFGIDRAENEKSYDYLKRAGAVKLGELKSSGDKIKELEEALKKGDPSGALQKKLEEEERKFKTILDEKNGEIKKLRGETERTRKEADVKLLYGDIKKTFVKTLPTLFHKIEAVTINEAIANSVLKEGKLYMANADGSIRKDSGYNEITVEEWLKQEFKDVIEKIKPPAGGGGGGKGGDPEPDPTKYTAETFPMKAEIKTRVGLMDYMDSLGLKRGTTLYNEIYKKHGASLAQQ
jgi:hypothetical protein